MKIKIQITVESDEGQPEVVQEVAHLDRGTLRPETLGLTLAEARSILAGIETLRRDAMPSMNSPAIRPRIVKPSQLKARRSIRAGMLMKALNTLPLLGNSDSASHASDRS
jgi:hypothetical protein